MVDFADKLRKLRADHRLTQLQVAERIGVTKAMISAYETGVRFPGYDTLIKISRLFGASTDYLLGLVSKNTIDVEGLSDEELALVVDLVVLLKKRQKM